MQKPKPTPKRMPYRFREYRLDPASRELLRDGEAVVLPASAFDCLLYLIENRHRAVGKDELIAAIWGRSDASDALLAQTLVRVRRALGDSGNAQHTVQTVPRFGYRWLADVVEEAAPETPVAAPIPTPMPAQGGGTGASAVPAPDPLQVPVSIPLRRRGYRFLAATLALALALTAAAWLLRAVDPHPATAIPPAGNPQLALGRSAVLVLPAEVDAPGDWTWLRLGLMDLVANRLRRGDLATAASESVIGIVGAEPGGAIAVRGDDPRFAAIAPLRVLPRASLEGDRWRVRLEVSGVAAPAGAEASGMDILGAGSDASDKLLVALGHLPPGGPAGEPPALNELLQRTRAAMLGNQFEQANRLIEAAPAALREHPQVEWLRANIELRSGDYAHAAGRLQNLLDSASGEEWRQLRGRVLVTLAAIHVRRNEDRGAESAYAEAIDLLEGGNDFNSLGLAYHGRGLVALVRGDVDAALPDLGRARTEMIRAGSLLGIAQIDVNIALSLTMRHRPAEALVVLDDVEQRVARIGAREELIHTYAAQVDNRIELLDYTQALAASDRCWPPARYATNERTAWRLRAIRARALLGVGRIDEAAALVAEIRDGADRGEDAVAIAHAEITAAQIALLRGDADDAVRSATLAGTSVLRNGEDMSWHVRAGLLKLHALRRAGRDDEAAAETARFADWAQARGGDWMQAMAETALARQHWAAGRRDAALALHASALSRIVRVGAPIDTIGVAEPYLLALIELARFDEAKAVNGQISAWADRDLRAASAQARLFAALGEAEAAQRASRLAARLSGSPES